MTREGENWRCFVKTVMALSLMNLLNKKGEKELKKWLYRPGEKD